MYNTLKEVQKAYPYEKLYEIAKKIAGQNPEKIVEIFKNEDIDISLDVANECIEYLKNLNVLKDEELENVAGGTCYSSDIRTYNIRDKWDNPITVTGHHVITTEGNSCDCYWPDDSKKHPDYLPTCYVCRYYDSMAYGATSYCKWRTKENDHEWGY